MFPSLCPTCLFLALQVLVLDNIWSEYEGEDVLSSLDLKNINKNDARSLYLVENFKKLYLGEKETVS